MVYGYGAGFPIAGSWVQNHLLAPRLVQPILYPRSVKWVPSTPGDLVVKSKLSPYSGFVALRHLNPIHIFFEVLIYCAYSNFDK